MRVASVSCFVVLLIANSALTQEAIFFWSPTPFGMGAEVEESFHNNNFGSDDLNAYDLFLYCVPFQEISDGIDFEFKFTNSEVVEAEIYNFDITLDGTPVGQRWDQIGPISIDRDTVSGFSASNKSEIGGLIHESLNNPYVDQGADITVSPYPVAFLVGRVRIKAVLSHLEYLATYASSDSAEVIPHFTDFDITAPDSCVLDPPFGGFGNSFMLSTDEHITGGTWHCTSQPFDSCDGTVWNRFEPHTSGIFTCNTFGSVLSNTLLQIYIGQTEEELELIATNDDADGTLKSQVSFPVEPGQRYSIRILSGSVPNGPISLSYDFIENAQLGDINGDNAIDLLDVAPFVESISGGTYIPQADINSDGNTDLSDANPFVQLLLQQ